MCQENIRGRTQRNVERMNGNTDGEIGWIAHVRVWLGLVEVLFETVFF